MRKVITLLLLLSILLSAGVVSAASTPVVYLDGKKLSFSTDPIIKNGTTLVPLRIIFEEQGAVVSWEPITRTVIAIKNEITITYTIGEKVAKRNQETLPLSVPGEVINGSTLVPLRFVSEALGNTVGWEGKSRTIIISSSQKANAVVTRVIDGDTIEVKMEDGSGRR